jgi:hypothetical protein
MANKSSSNIREKFGLYYLISESAPSSSSSSRARFTDPATERTLAAFGNRILSQLDGMPSKQARLFELVDQTGLKMETLLKTTDKLNQLGLVQMLENDKYGNHRVQLTQVGSELIHSG